MALRQNQQWISLETLTPDTLYEFQVRVRSGPREAATRLGAPGVSPWPSGRGLQVPVGRKGGTELRWEGVAGV